MPRDPDGLRMPRLSTFDFLHNKKKWRRALFTLAPLETSVLGQRRPDLAAGWRLESAGTRATREDSACPARPPSSPLSSAVPRSSGPGAGGRRPERVASQSPLGTLGPAPAPGANPLATRPGGAAGTRPPPLAPPAIHPPQGPQRRGGSGAAKRPGRAGSRRKDARALGGSEVIKGKEPAAGGSGRFSCSRRCCLVFALLEGRSLVGRRCRPQ